MRLRKLRMPGEARLRDCHRRHGAPDAASATSSRRSRSIETRGRQAMRERGMIFRTMGIALGVALATLINIFNFPLYLLERRRARRVGSVRTRHVRRRSRQRSFTYRNAKTRVEKAPCLATKPVCIGAAYLPFQALAAGGPLYVLARHRYRYRRARALLVDSETGLVRASLHRGARRDADGCARCGPSSGRRTGGTRRRRPIRGVLAEAGVTGREVDGIGLSGQMHGLTLLDDGGQRHPTRAHLVRSAQPGAGGLRSTARRAATRCSTTPRIRWSPASRCRKLLWVRDNEPAALRANPQSAAARRITCASA